MIKVNVMLDNKEYESKPQGVEIAKLTKRLVNEKVEISIEDLANKLSKGCTFKCSAMAGSHENDWVQEQIFALDFDENITIEDGLNRARELDILPAFIYTSFSHTEEHNRFRMVFCTNEVITDYDIAKKVQLTLMQLFPNSDQKCKNNSRIYFGGRSLVYEGYENILNYKELLKKYPLRKDSVIKDTSKEKKPHNNKDIKIINNKHFNSSINNNSDFYIQAIQKLDDKMLRKLIISRIYSERVFDGLIDYDYILYLLVRYFSKT